MAERIPLERLHGLRQELRDRGIRRDLWATVCQEVEELWQANGSEQELDDRLDQLEGDYGSRS